MHQKLLTIILTLFFTLPSIAQNPPTEQQEMKTFIDLAKKMPLEEALPYLVSLYQVVVEQFGEQDSMTAKVLNRKGTKFFQNGDYQLAIKEYKKMQAIQKKVYEEKHKDISRIEHLMGASHSNLNENEKAIQHYQNAINLRKK